MDIYFSVNVYTTRKKELYLKTVSDIFRNFVGFELVQVQPLLAQSDNIFYTEFKISEGDPTESNLILKYRQINAYSRGFKTRYEEQELNCVVNSFCDEMCREILCDVRNNCSTDAKKQFDSDPEKIY